MMNINKEALDKVSKCKNVEEVLKLAKENNYEISKEKAEELFNKTHSNGELSDAELNGVAGGGCGSSNDTSKPECYERVLWEKKEQVEYLFNVGDQITIYCQKDGKIHKAKIRKIRQGFTVLSGFKKSWFDVYDTEYKSNCWQYPSVDRSDILKS